MDVDERPRRRIDIGHVVFGLLLLLPVGALAAPKLMEARRHGNEAAAIGALKTIGRAEALFREGDCEHDGNLDYGMLSELYRAELVDPELGSGTRRGYFFQVNYSFNTSEFLWFGLANPTRPGYTGERYFATNQAGEIFYTSRANLVPDTDTCVLPNDGRLPTGR